MAPPPRISNGPRSQGNPLIPPNLISDRTLRDCDYSRSRLDGPNHLPGKAGQDCRELIVAPPAATVLSTSCHRRAPSEYHCERRILVVSSRNWSERSIVRPQKRRRNHAISAVCIRHTHSIVLNRPIVLILGYKSRVLSPKHRRPDRHNLSLMNPQEYFVGCAIFRYPHLSTSIAYFS